MLGRMVIGEGAGRGGSRHHAPPRGGSGHHGAPRGGSGSHGSGRGNASSHAPHASNGGARPTSQGPRTDSGRGGKPAPRLTQPKPR